MSDMTVYEMSCDAFADRLADYLENDAADDVRAAMEGHATTCAPCRALLADLMAIPQAAGVLPPLVPSRDLWQGIAERIDAPVLPLAGARRETRFPSLRRGWVRPAVAAAALVLFTASVTHVLTRAALTPAPVVASSGNTIAPLPAPVAAQPAPGAPAAAQQVAAVTSASSRADTPRADAPRSTPRQAERVLGSAAAAQRAGSTVRLASAGPLLGEVEPVYDREITKLRAIVRDRRAQLDPHTIAVLEQSVAVIDSAIAQSRAALAKDPASGFLATQLNHSLEKKVELLRTASMLPART